MVGCGSIGSRHLANLRGLGVGRLAVADPDPARREAAEADAGAHATYADHREALKAETPDAVLICTPPVLHVAQALDAVRAGAHLFVEKPLSHDLGGVEELLQEARDRNRILQVGYNLRFHPGPRRVRELLDDGAVGRVLWARAEVSQYLPDWRPDRDYRKTYTAVRKEGGGVLLDASHEGDLLRWLLGEVEEVACMAGTFGDLDVDVEDTAALLLRFHSGVLGEVHLDFVRRDRARGLVVCGTGGTLVWDHVAGTLDHRPADGPARTEDVEADPNAMYVAEMEAFLAAVAGGEAAPPRGAADGEEGLRTLQVVLAAKEAARTGRTVRPASTATEGGETTTEDTT